MKYKNLPKNSGNSIVTWHNKHPIYYVKIPDAVFEEVLVRVGEFSSAHPFPEKDPKEPSQLFNIDIFLQNLYEYLIIIHGVTTENSQIKIQINPKYRKYQELVKLLVEEVFGETPKQKISYESCDKVNLA